MQAIYEKTIIYCKGVRKPTVSAINFNWITVASVTRGDTTSITNLSSDFCRIVIQDELPTLFMQERVVDRTGRWQ